MDRGAHVNFIDIWHFNTGSTFHQKWNENAKLWPKFSLSVLCLKSRVGSEHEMSLEKKVIDPPSIGDYLHGYTLSYQSYGSLWQLLGTGAWFWTRENVKKGQFFRKFWDRPWLFFIVLYVSCTCFILKCLKILKSRDHVSPACKPILANLKIHWKIKSHIWALSASHFLDQKNYPLPPSRKCQIFTRLGVKQYGNRKDVQCV